MSDKAKFFQLGPSHQVRLRSFIALLAISNLVQSLVRISATATISPSITIIANLALLYCTIFIKNAPEFYFRIIVWLVVVVIIFDGLVVASTLVSRTTFTIGDVLSLVDLVLIAVFSQSILAYRTVTSSKQTL